MIKRQLILSLLILLVSAGLFWGLTQLKGNPEKEANPFSLPLVKLQELSPESVSLTVNSQGVVRPAIETRLVTEVAGVVKTVSPLFVSGAVFEKGALLATLDDSDYQVALSQAEAALAASQARLAEEQARSEAEKQNWLRSGKKLAQAPALLLRTPYVAEAQARVKAASAQLAKAQRDLAKTVIRAPYRGMVRERTMNIGQYLAPGNEIGRIFSIDYGEVRLPITPSDLGWLDRDGGGQPRATIRVTLEQQLGQKRQRWDGIITRAEGVVDERSRMHYLVARVDDPYGLEQSQTWPLKAGSFVYATLQGRTLDNLFRIPRSALYGSGQIMVARLLEPNRYSLHFRKVTQVYASGSDVFVTGDLQPGEQLSLTALGNPVEGMQVKTAVAADSRPVINLSNRQGGR